METRLSKLESEGKFDSTRQRDIFDPLTHQDASCVLVGCGGIGSPTAIALSKLGIPKLTLIDFDGVEAHNVPNQFYSMDDTDKPKVEALAEHCKMFGAAEIEVAPVPVGDVPDLLHGVVITGLDSMAARKEVWDLVKMQVRVERLIDARIGKEDIVVYTINPTDIDDIKYYEEFCLYSDEKAEELACTERGIIDVSFSVASMITRNVRRHFNTDDIHRTITWNQGTLAIAKG